MEYQIGDFSTISRLSVKTLRYYHDYGLLVPNSIDPESGYRFYSEKSLDRVRIINALKDMEFPLKDIKKILENCSEDEDIVEYMTKKSDEIRQKIDKYQKIQKSLDRFLVSANSGLGSTTSDNRQIIIKDIPEVLIASLRTKCRYSEVGKLFGKLFRKSGTCISAPFSLYYDGEYKEEDADVEACVPVKKETNSDEIGTRILSGGKAATLLHKGPYETIGETYKVLIDYMHDKQLGFKLPIKELYIKGPGIIFRGNPNKYLTEVQFFIK